MLYYSVIATYDHDHVDNLYNVWGHVRCTRYIETDPKL